MGILHPLITAKLRVFSKLPWFLKIWPLAFSGAILILLLHYYLHRTNDMHPTFIEQNIPLIDKRSSLLIMNIYDRFKPRILESCNNTCIFHHSVCQAKDFDTWEQVFKLRKVPGVSLLFENEYLFPWEKDYLSHPPLEDVRSLPDVQKSSVYLLTNGVPNKENQVKAKVGQKVHFRLDLVDDYGRRRKYGGDEIRVWLAEDLKVKPQKGYTAAGLVTDLNNGSYLVTVSPLWTGLTQLKIAFMYPREYIRAALLQARLGSHRFLLGMFKKGNIQESDPVSTKSYNLIDSLCSAPFQPTFFLYTPPPPPSFPPRPQGTVCHPTPNIPGRPCVCNLTHFNEMSFFCGRPLDSRLSCKDWHSTRPALTTPFKNFTEAEYIMDAYKARPMNEALIPHDIRIDVTSNGNGPTVPPCIKHDYTITWTKESPRGMWSGDSWTYLVCKAPPATPQMAQKCLSNYTILFIGDSNSIRLRAGVARLIPVKAKRKATWPQRYLHYNQLKNITMILRPHEYPLYMHQAWVPILRYGGIVLELDKIPSHRKYAVVIHYYYHLTVSHLSAFYLRLKALKESLSRLINRNPDVLIAVRGPHLSTVQWETNHMFGGEVFGPFMTLIWREMFKDMRHRIVYLDGWDISIGIQNTNVHPPGKMTDAMAKHLVSLWCL